MKIILQVRPEGKSSVSDMVIDFGRVSVLACFSYRRFSIQQRLKPGIYLTGYRRLVIKMVSVIEALWQSRNFIDYHCHIMPDET